MRITNKTIHSLRGFTLLELIVAIALMSVIAVALYSSIYTAFKVKKQSQRLLKPFQAITPAFEFMRHDLVSAVKPDGILAGVFLGQDGPGQSGLDADTLEFYTCSYQPSEDEITSNIIKVAYALENDFERDQIVLKRFLTKNILSPTTQQPQEEIVCRDIAGLDIQYYDGSSWLDEWDSSVENAQLPWGVRITLIVYDETKSRSSDENFRDFTRIFTLPFANQEVADQESGGEDE